MDEMNYMEDGSLDYQEVQEKVFYNLDNNPNIEECIRELDEV